MSARFFRLYLKLLRGVAVSFIFSLALVSAAEAEVCFLPTVGAGGSCSGSSGGSNPNPNLEKCPTGYTAYASKPDCDIGKKAEQNGTVNGKGCYKCVDEKSSDCSRGKLDLDCAEGEARKEVGKTDSGLKCYECVDDVCPTGYTSDSESCKNSQNTGYAVLKEGVKTPSGGRCYTCGKCQIGYQYKNSTPDDNECKHWTQETGTSCYKPSDTEKVSACPKGGTQTPCDASQTVTESYENSCGKMCYKCEADSGESNDPSANKCICPVNQKLDTKSGKCVDKTENKIFITPEIRVSKVGCAKTESKSITYEFLANELEIRVQSEEPVNKEVTVYMWIINATYNLSEPDQGNDNQEGLTPDNQEEITTVGGLFDPVKFREIGNTYTLMSCSIPTGGTQCFDFKRNVKVRATANRIESYNSKIYCPKDVNLESEKEKRFSPLLIPYRYIGVISSADDDTYRYTAKLAGLTFDANVWFGPSFVAKMKQRCSDICNKDEEGNYDPNEPACNPFGHQGNWGEKPWEGSWYNSAMSRLTSNTCTYEHDYDTWPIKALNKMMGNQEKPIGVLNKD